jgi:hypothetical protein
MVALLAASVLVSGCAAGKASIHLVAADNAISRAAARDAEQGAPYEFTMATRYLSKAREEFGEADFRVAEALSKASAKWADKAIIAIEQKGPTVEVGGLSDEAVTAPSPEAAPAPAPASSEVDPLLEPSTSGPVVPPADAPPPEPDPEEEKSEFDELENLDPDDEEDDFDWGPK